MCSVSELLKTVKNDYHLYTSKEPVVEARNTRLMIEHNVFYASVFPVLDV